MRQNRLLAFCWILILAGSRWSQSSAADDSYEDLYDRWLAGESQAKVVTLDDHCANGVCSGFQYDSLDEIAQFQLRSEIRIGDDATYDIIENKTLYRNLVFLNCTFATFPLNLFAVAPVEELDMRNCSIEGLSSHSFKRADNLRILMLSENKLSYIKAFVFLPAAELSFLFLDYNQIETLQAASFMGLKKLKHLNLEHNLLSELPDDLWRGLPSLEELNLAHNQLRIVSNELFLSVPRLCRVDLQANQIEKIGEESFKVQKYLEVLAISHNKQLKELDLYLDARYLFAANCSLRRVKVLGLVEHVDMRDNVIQKLELSQPQSLITINLHNNALKDIASLYDAMQLQLLDLGGNTELNLSVPWQAESLERLDLSNTGMKEMLLQLEKMPKLRSLNVSNNQLEVIELYKLKYYEQLSHFFIHGNYWNCYNLRYIMDMVILPNGITYTPDRCDDEFAGVCMNGIECMYRIDGDPNEHRHFAESLQKENLVEEEKSLKAQIDELRRELKAIVGFYENKMDKVFRDISDLDKRMQTLEQFNSTMWDHITIMT